MSFLSPTLSLFGMTEHGNFFQHCLHQGWSQLPEVGWLSLVYVMSFPTIIVEGREVVKEVTPSLHVPSHKDNFIQLGTYTANYWIAQVSTSITQ